RPGTVGPRVAVCGPLQRGAFEGGWGGGGPVPAAGHAAVVHVSAGAGRNGSGLSGGRRTGLARRGAFGERGAATRRPRRGPGPGDSVRVVLGQCPGTDAKRAGRADARTG